MKLIKNRNKTWGLQLYPETQIIKHPMILIHIIVVDSNLSILKLTNRQFTNTNANKEVLVND